MNIIYKTDHLVKVTQIICKYLPNPSAMSWIWHKVDFKAE